MQKENLLKLMIKYGFHSFNKEPFLYEGKNEIGIAYTFKDPFYGTLTRIFIPETPEDAENFLAQYYWYKKNGQSYNVRIELDDYETEKPKLTFTQNQKPLTLKEMQNLESQSPKEESQKEKNYIQRLKRSALLLLQIIEEKINIQNTTYQNLIKFTNQYEEKLYELNLKKKEYLKSKEEIPKPVVYRDEIIDYHDQLKEMEQSVSDLNQKEELENYIIALTNFLKELEMSESLIQNKYELIRKPLEINSINEQLEELEERMKSKKNKTSKSSQKKETKKENPLNAIVSYETYRENERKRIEEKYTMIPEMDIRTIGDFLADFDNIQMKEPILKTENQEIGYESTMKDLEINFANRSKEEQNLLILYHSPLKKLYDSLLTHHTKKEELNEAIELINNPNNILLKIKYFRHFNTTSPDTFKDSVLEEFTKLENIKPEELLADINVFLKHDNNIEFPTILTASNKRVFAPSQETSSKEMIYIIRLKKNSQIYFVPTKIAHDIEQEDTLMLQPNHPLILIDLKKNKIIEEKSDILKVVHYERVIQEEKNIKYVTGLKEINTELYKNISIERRYL